MSGDIKHPVTPDGRYFVVRGRLWRMTDPSLNSELKSELVDELMNARRAVGAALKNKDKAGEANARQHVDIAKRSLGERGSVWWRDGSPDYNRHFVKNNPYAFWYQDLGSEKVFPDD